jgi:glycerol-3-phosphate dehydrogenase (NAD(P)+)
VDPRPRRVAHADAYHRVHPVIVSVIGAGGWGTAFARLLARSGHSVTLWVRDPRRAEAIDGDRVNGTYLPGVLLPRKGLHVTSSLSEAIASETIVLAVPSFAMSDVLARVAPLLSGRRVFVNLAKGLEQETRSTMSEVIARAIPGEPVFTLSGPCHAEEVGRDMPTAVVLAGRDLELGKELQLAFSTARFRVYLSDDLRGVELCSTVKNVIALATGASDGLGYGDNSRGALITRGLAEMVRFGKAFGAREETFFGLSGVGDLVATCTSEHSRNRAVGARLGKGESLGAILAGMRMVAEGVYATKVVHEMAEERGIDMPITEAVHCLLYEGADPHALVDAIMTRSPKREAI